jgi:uncharacterized protein
VSVRRLDRDETRQLAVRAQLLDATKPTDLVDLVDQLTLLQVDPTAAIAPNADLVAWSRLGPSYQPADLAQVLEKERTLFELRAYIRPMTAVALHVPEGAGCSAHPKSNPGLQRMTAFSATSSPVCATPVHFSHAMCPTPVKFHVARPAGGMIAMSRRCWSCFPREARSRSREGWGGNSFGISPSVSTQVLCPFLPRKARRLREEQRLRALGIARTKTGVVPGEPLSVGDAGVPVTVEGLDGYWRADPEAMTNPLSAVQRCCRRSTASFPTRPHDQSFSTSSTSSKCTSRRRSAAGVTSRCRCFTMTDW